MIRELFAKRRLEFSRQTAKYLRYVFNDHFVLVLMFLMGATFYQYSQLLKDFPKESFWLQVVLIVLQLLITRMGKIALFLEPADKIFLLPKEREVLSVFQRAKRYSQIIGVIFQILAYLLLAPLLSAAGWSKIGLIVLVILLVGLRIVRIEREYASFASHHLNWDKALAYELKRQKGILSFFSLFTQVKGITTRVKPRSYLNFLLKLIKKTSQNTWLYLYSRAYLRQGDYLALTVRLVALALVLGWSLSNSVLAMVIMALFVYLLLFQLISLYRNYDYQLMIKLYPSPKDHQKRGFIKLMRVIIYPIAILTSGFLLPHIESLYCFLIIVALIELYLPYKLKNLVD